MQPDGVPSRGWQPSRSSKPLSGYSTYGTWAYRRRLESAYTDWIHGRGRFTHFVTLTFKLTDSSGHRTTQKTVEEATRHLLRRLACSIHGKRRIKYRPPIKSVVVIDWGIKGNHPHAHLMLEAPADMTYGQFSALIEAAMARIRLLDKERRIQPYEDREGAKYLVKHGIDRMVVSLFDAPQAP